MRISPHTSAYIVNVQSDGVTIYCNGIYRHLDGDAGKGFLAALERVQKIEDDTRFLQAFDDLCKLYF